MPQIEYRLSGSVHAEHDFYLLLRVCLDLGTEPAAVHVRLNVPFLDEPLSRWTRELTAEDMQEVAFRGLRAERPGSHLIEVCCHICRGSGTEVWRGDFPIEVEPESSGDVNVHIQAGENVVADFEGMIDRARPERREPLGWKPLFLDRDSEEERSIADQWSGPQIPLAIQERMGSLWELDGRVAGRAGAGCVLRGTWGEGPFAIVPGNVLELGRDSRKNHVALRVLPRSSANDARTRKISSRHLEIDVTRSFPQIVDRSRFGTAIDAEPLVPATPAWLGHGTRVAIADAMSLTSEIYRDARGLTALGLRPSIAGQQRIIAAPVYVALGSDPGCALRTKWPGAPVAAVLFALRDHQDSSAVTWKVWRASEQTRVLVSGELIEPFRAVSLKPPVVVMIGNEPLDITE